ncbi:MAG: type II toxin-antitoxin system RelE/ParE family toxin [Gammaproteobacteria bacterium]|nr:type II toxin-antitoxin system RelE/ParE family toxin [Gammaproteobacteria bacterium]MCY4322225.1 type II toxin-antitoxin system RelE/ParE family toxin [Gammaproteobacteria bacterium]
MRTFKTKPFVRFAGRKSISDRALCEAVERIENGLVDADLGGGIFKQRIARTGQGRSRGLRAVLVLRRGEYAFFVHGFAKNDRENLRAMEIKALRVLANELLQLDKVGLDAMLANKTISEVNYDD